MSMRTPIHNDTRREAPLPWSRKTPRRKAAEVRGATMSIENIHGAYYARGDYRFKYPAAKKARRVIENRGLRVSEADEKAMRKHRRKSNP